MKNLHRIILSVICCLTICKPVSAQSNDNNGIIPFGTMKDSTKAMVARLGAQMSFESNGAYADHFYLNYEQYYHLGDSCSLFMTFYKNKLAAYVISDYKNPKAKTAFKKLKKLMQHKYGNPAAVSKGSERTTINWLLDPKEEKEPKQVMIELVKGENNETGILEQYVSKEEYEWREKNPAQKTD